MRIRRRNEKRKCAEIDIGAIMIYTIAFALCFLLVHIICISLSLSSLFLSDKYYDLDLWYRTQSHLAPKVDDLAGLTDEDRVRLARQRSSASSSAAHVDARVQMMKEMMARERATGSDAWKDIQKRSDEGMKTATFESIAKGREQDRKDKEAIDKDKFRPKR